MQTRKEKETAIRAFMEKAAHGLYFEEAVNGFLNENEGRDFQSENELIAAFLEWCSKRLI